MTVAAEIALAGMDPMVFMRSQDPETVQTMELIAAAAQRRRRLYMEELAVLIANKVGDLFRG